MCTGSLPLKELTTGSSMQTSLHARLQGLLESWKTNKQTKSMELELVTCPMQLHAVVTTSSITNTITPGEDRSTINAAKFIWLVKIRDKSKEVMWTVRSSLA